MFNSCWAGGCLFNTILLHHRLEMLLQFLQAVPAPASPTNETTLCHFLAFLDNRSLSPQTVSMYLSACRFFHIASGLPDPLLSSLPQLTYVLKGMRHSDPTGRRVKLPITPEILEAIQTRWSVRPVSFDRIMLWAAFCLAFFAFL